MQVTAKYYQTMKKLQSALLLKTNIYFTARASSGAKDDDQDGVPDSPWFHYFVTTFITL